MKILVTGSKGQLGSEIMKISRIKTDLEWVFTDVDEFDLSKLDLINAFLEKINPKIIINCAAYTAVDNAENNFHLVNLINNESVSLISKWTSANNCKLIHVSTDYVFEGNSHIPLTEEEETNPINTYGKTKFLGENACRTNDLNSIVIRTSWVYSSFGANFVKTMIKLMKSKSELSIVSDQIGSPTYAFDLAEAIIKIILNKKWIPGIYHFSNDGEISWFEFAQSIKNIYGFKTVLKSISSDFFPTLAKRPKYSLLDKSKIKNTYGIEIKNYLSSLSACINILKFDNYE